jgi:hypothetical protein
MSSGSKREQRMSERTMVRHSMQREKTFQKLQKPPEGPTHKKEPLLNKREEVLKFVRTAR